MQEQPSASDPTAPPSAPSETPAQQPTPEPDVRTVEGWFRGRLPEGWFTSLSVSLADGQILVVGTLPAVELGPEASAEHKQGAGAGRIARFREGTRGERIHIAREAEHHFGRPVTWGAASGEVSKTFTPGGSGWSRGEGQTKVMIGRRGPGSRWRRHLHRDLQSF